MAVGDVVKKALYEICSECEGSGCRKCVGQGLVPHRHVAKVETFSTPGTADVTPSDLKRLRPLLEHYRKSSHPFGECKRDQIKHGLSEEHANRRCAVIKDLIEGNTHWRNGGVHKHAIDWRGREKVVKADGAWTDEVVEAIDRVADALDLAKDGRKKKRPTGAVARLMSQDC